MLGMGWLTLRQAQEALENGRLEEAARLLGQPEVQGHKGASPLLRQLAQELVKRAEAHLQHDNPAAAWNDLRQAEKWGPIDGKLARLRQALTRRELTEVQKLLEVGEAKRAAEVIAR